MHNKLKTNYLAKIFGTCRFKVTKFNIVESILEGIKIKRFSDMLNCKLLFARGVFA